MTGPMTRAQLLELLADQPAWPDDHEFGRWSSEQRQSFIAAMDAQVAQDAATRPKTTRPRA
jgi:hypothetical protein